MSHLILAGLLFLVAAAVLGFGLWYTDKYIGHAMGSDSQTYEDIIQEIEQERKRNG